jgi:hypothetical protein
MEERTRMKGRMEEKRESYVKGEGWKKEKELCCF